MPTEIEAAVANILSKTQNVRLVDVFLLGPFMVWSGYQLNNDLAKIAMIGSGVATIIYNWNNYQTVQALRKQGLVE